MLIYYSLISGEVYEIQDDEADNLDQYQIPLLKKPNPKCGVCYGRGYVGRDIVKKYFPMCPCISRQINGDRLKSDINLKY